MWAAQSAIGQTASLLTQPAPFYITGGSSSYTISAGTNSFVTKLSPGLSILDSNLDRIFRPSINGPAVDLRLQRFPSMLSNVEVYTAGYRFTGSTATQSEKAFAVKLVEPPVVILK